MNELSENDRKRLTEYLGECWHELKHLGWKDWVCSCGAKKCERSSFHRTFTTWQDFGDLKNKLVEKGEWKEFIIYSIDIWSRENHFVDFDPEEHTDWLINAKRFCGLVNGWLKSKEDKKDE